jgi:maleamate amidohydrolase
MEHTLQTYQRQGFGTALDLVAPFGLLIVDFVNGFADPEAFGGGNIGAAIANTVPVLETARAQRWPIAHSRIVFAADGADGNVFSLKVPGLLRLTEEDWNSAIVPGLAPRKGELVVRKTNPSAFFGTPLAAWLTQRGVQTLLIAGSTTSGCVRASVVDAMSHGFRPLVLSDCVGDRAQEPHDANLFDMQQKYATVMSASEALSAIADMPRVPG